MPLQGDAVADLIITTLRKLGRGNFNEIVTTMPEYVGFRDLLKAKQKQNDGGYGVQRNLMVGTSGNARWTGMYATQQVNRADVAKAISIPYRIAITSYAISEIEIAMNNGSAEKIVDMLSQQRAGADIDLAELIEPAIWTKPDDSNDTALPYGFQYWLPWTDNSASDLGFGTGMGGFSAGALPTGFTDVGGLNPTTYDTWNPWAAKFTNYSEDDLLDKWRLMFDQCGFMPPVEIPEYGKGMDWVWYMGHANKRELIKLVRSQNENLGMELQHFGTAPTFAGVPCKWVPALDSTTIVPSGADPILGINWRTFSFESLSGWYMRESPPIRPDFQPDARIVYKHLIWNLLCNNRRKNGVLAKSDWETTA